METLRSIFDVGWKPRVLIEASAGTGKTYTIVGLFVRLLAEKNLNIDQILVMTFTKKATAELRDRIFARLQDCLSILEGRYQQTPDTFLKKFAENFSGNPTVVNTIRESIRNFDENQVTTIHGFCQKVLSEEALSAGTPFEVEVARQDELLARAAEDYWRNIVYRYSHSEAGRYLLSKLLEMAATPDDLKNRIQPLLSKPYAVIEGERIENPREHLGEVITLRRELTECWNDDSDKILSILHNCELSRYQQHLNSRLNHLKNFLHDENFNTDTTDKLQYFTSAYLQDRSNIPKTKDVDLPENHRFFELCTRYEKLVSDIDDVKTTLLYEAAGTIKELREGLAEQSGTVTYDDMLMNVKKALESSRTGHELAQSLAIKYPFALVDEFQDTDPIQYRIFQKIYEGANGTDSSLCMIGDPKQAIYAFRGADVYTYLRARGEAGEDLFTLQKNYRSTPTMIRAVNSLFNADQQPFLEREIKFFESDAGLSSEDSLFTIDGKPADQMHITIKEDLDMNKNPGREFAISHTVSEISRLITLGLTGRATIDGVPLRAGDIAVLVNTHSQAASIKKRLKDIGIDSVTYSKQKVFGTFEADRMEMMLAAILNPHDLKSFNSALLSGFFGVQLSELLELKEDEGLRLQIIQELQELHDLWKKRGFYPMFRRLTLDSGRLEILASFNQAERTITNLYQIAEICSEVEKSEELDPHSLFTWFRREKRDPGEGDENTLMLESDQDLVKISTIHNSKGLQYPVVFCPYLWETKQNQGSVLEYHDENTHQYRINIDQNKNEDFKRASRRAMFESIAEDVRKAYVALTRAQYYLDLCWVNHRESNISGFGALLTGRQSVTEYVENGTKMSESEKPDTQTFPELMRQCAERSKNAIVLHTFSEHEEAKTVSPDSLDRGALTYASRDYRGRDKIDIRQTVNSFSSINRHSGVDVYEPDYDQVMDSYAGAFDSPSEESEERSVFTFPRGATAGTAIHKLFEDEQFSFRDVLQTDYTEMIEGVLMRYGFDKEWASVADRMLKDVTQSLIPGLQLWKVDEADQLREMEFLFMANRAEAKDLFTIIREGRKRPVSGIPDDFLTGFIDLTVRQGGKYFILDYKSNHLGNQLEDYSNENLKAEIEANGYDLQYHLYTLALVKFLEKRVPDFDYDIHFGGVAYLFVRGMQAGKSSGVWFHKPKESIIRNLEDFLGGMV